MFPEQDVTIAFCLAFANAGNSITASIAIIAITTSNSMSVNRLCILFSKIVFHAMHNYTKVLNWIDIIPKIVHQVNALWRFLLEQVYLLVSP